MTASERLRELDGAMTAGRWVNEPNPQGDPYVFDLAYDDSECERIAALRNALPLIADCIEAAETHLDLCSRSVEVQRPLAAALTALRDSLEPEAYKWWRITPDGERQEIPRDWPGYEC